MLALLATTCVLLGSGAFTAPDNACTPGAYAHLSRAAACVHKDRPNWPAVDRRRMLAQYGVPGWSGKDGELDHRVPFFLGGLTVEDNGWPEPDDQLTNYRNAKDRLEHYVYRRVCHGDPSRMRLRTGRRIFLHDWRTAYRRYF